MINFKRLQGPHGIPVYYQHLPVTTVSVYWLVFVGSADDESAGGRGIYHWFEHIPSRGTVKYPGGYQDTEARLVRYGGEAGAETGYSFTSYYAHVPLRAWVEALEILTDMIAQPLLRDEDIDAEREVIGQEIDEWHSSPYQESMCLLPEVLWPGHPLGHDQLGSRESLAAIAPETLRQAHQLGYHQSRCVLFVSGGIDEASVLREVERCAADIPSAPQVTPRSGPVSYGPLPAWRANETTIIPTSHDDSVMYLLFPLPPQAQMGQDWLKHELLDYLINSGDLGSPLYQVVREEAQLAYSPDFVSTHHIDGGYWGFVVQTNGRHPDEVFDTFWKLLKSPRLRSPDWYQFVRDTIEGEFEMQGPRPEEFTDAACERLLAFGEIWDDETYRRKLLATPHHDLIDFLDALTPEQTRRIIFQPGG